MTPTLQAILGFLALAATITGAIWLYVFLITRAAAAETRRREGRLL